MYERTYEVNFQMLKYSASVFLKIVSGDFKNELLKRNHQIISVRDKGKIIDFIFNKLSNVVFILTACVISTCGAKIY
ncbi:unnamed protein product [Rhizophagus irregularis]|nr:unnamed protein product [Rhizophagus irregularis]CAB4435053.1 unnamed protein product [Rhizophagus irregularis]